MAALGRLELAALNKGVVLSRLHGLAVRAVLFHNGTWSDWRETLRRMPANRLPDGQLSDTRVAASLVDLCGTDALGRLPGRWVIFDRDFTELLGDWQRWRGMQVSNLGFERHLHAAPLHQATLKLPSACGYTDTSRRRK